MKSLVKTARSLLHDRLFYIGLSSISFYLSFDFFTHTELALLEQAPDLPAVISCLALAAGLRSCNQSDLPRQFTWFCCSIAAVILILAVEIALDPAVWPWLGYTDVSASLLPSGASALALGFFAAAFYGFGQLAGQELRIRTMPGFVRVLCAGGLFGIALFTLCMAKQPGPWCLLPAMFLVPHRPRLPVFVGFLALATWLVATDSKFSFSPYGKLEIKTVHEGRLLISANGVPFQHCASMPPVDRLESLSGTTHMQPHSELFRHELARLRALSYPIRANQGKLDDVLVLGAGSGNDVAFLLSNGARKIDAVERDAVLLELGDRHPDKPYQNPAVKTYIDDPRAFLSRTNKRYDLIDFCQVSPGRTHDAFYPIRLNAFLHTVEALNQALAHLKPTGIVFVGLADDSKSARRLLATLRASNTPYKISAGQKAALDKSTWCLAGPGLAHFKKSNPWLFAQFTDLNSLDESSDTRVVSDNWPFLQTGIDTYEGLWLIVELALCMVALVCLRRTPGASPEAAFIGAILCIAAFLTSAAIVLLIGCKWFVQPATLSALCLLLAAAFSLPIAASGRTLFLVSIVTCVLALISSGGMLVVFLFLLLGQLCLVLARAGSTTTTPHLVLASILVGACAGWIGKTLVLWTGLKLMLALCMLVISLVYLAGRLRQRANS